MYLYLFLISFVVNVLLVWYIREYMKRVNLWWQTLRVFKEDVLRYKLIVKEVYGMEVYYGEPTIQSLLNETGKMVETYEELDTLVSQMLGSTEDEEI